MGSPGQGTVPIGSHYVPAPSSGICPREEAPRERKGAEIPISSKLGMGISRRCQDLAKPYYETLENPSRSGDKPQRGKNNLYLFILHILAHFEGVGIICLKQDRLLLWQLREGWVGKTPSGKSHSQNGPKRSGFFPNLYFFGVRIPAIGLSPGITPYTADLGETLRGMGPQREFWG